MAPAIQAIVRGPSAHNHARSLSAVWWELILRSRGAVASNVRVNGLCRPARPGMHAIGGVDLALWDLRGKIEASCA